MVAAHWRHGSLAVFAATLLMARHAAADPSLRTTPDVSLPAHPEATLRLSAEATAQLIPEAMAQLIPQAMAQLIPAASLIREASLPRSPEAVFPLIREASLPRSPEASLPRSPEAGLPLVPPVAQLIPPVNAQLIPPVNAQLIPPVNAQLIPPVNAQLSPPVTVQKVGSVLERVPTASWAMGCAAGIALAMHAVYQTSSDRHRTRMKSCADDCPNYRIDDYKETRERADVALRLSVFAAASALWLVYNDPQEALERMGQRKPPRQQAGFRVKVKPERRGVWASVVAYF